MAPVKNSIRVQSKAEYVIEVNEQGETISFDLTDTSLTSRLFQMYESIDSITQEHEARLAEIETRPDEPYSSTTVTDPETGEETTRVLLTKNQYDAAQLLDGFYQEARGALDKFMGRGACQKIFGDKNYTNMFIDLLEQLQPHFDKMGMKVEDIKHSAAAKHKPNRAKRRAMA